MCAGYFNHVRSADDDSCGLCCVFRRIRWTTSCLCSTCSQSCSPSLPMQVRTPQHFLIAIRTSHIRDQAPSALVFQNQNIRTSAHEHCSEQFSEGFLLEQAREAIPGTRSNTAVLADISAFRTAGTCGCWQQGRRMQEAACRKNSRSASRQAAAAQQARSEREQYNSQREVLRDHRREGAGGQGR